MKRYIVKVYDRELALRCFHGLWKSERDMLNELIAKGYKPIDWREV